MTQLIGHTTNGPYPHGKRYITARKVSVSARAAQYANSYMYFDPDFLYKAQVARNSVLHLS